MATPEDITLLRDYINEPHEDGGWTDYRLSLYLNRTTTPYGAASEIWGVKAGEYAGMVNVSESGSSRSLSDLFTHAKTQQAHYAAKHAEAVAPVAADVGSPVIRRIRRSL